MSSDQIAVIRSFNRAITQRIGALQESYLSRGRPLGEARLLFEIGTGGADLRDLREKLNLDFGLQPAIAFAGSAGAGDRGEDR